MANKSTSKNKTTEPVLVTTNKVSSTKPRFLVLLLAVILLGSLTFIAAKKYRHLFVVAIVNTTPITRHQLDEILVSRYGKTTLDEMINVTLLKQLADKNQVTVSNDEVQGEIKRLEDSLGGKEALQSNMERFGIDQAKLEEEMRAIIIQKKLSQKLFPVKIEDAEILKYYQDNKVTFGKQSFDEVKDKIKASLEDQKYQQQFSTWFQEQKTKAKIQVYI